MNFGCRLLAMAIAAIPVAAVCAPAQVFFGSLNGSQESPPNASPGTGFAVVTYDPDTYMMRVQVTFSNLAATSGNGTTASHIHCCFILPVLNASVATTTPSFAGFPTGVRAGTYDNTLDMTLASSYNPSFVTAQGSIAAARSAILAGMANGTAYFNIHSVVNPGGEIRSNLQADAVFANGFELTAG
ncbi:MAG TPA: CHRD domain-containing protein [Rudaea sp.]|nr:CHRD domain-containing protein [Rudaea sp.]